MVADDGAIPSQAWCVVGPDTAGARAARHRARAERPAWADEAIVGLMARHILEAGERPVFYLGQAYLGAADAYLLAGLFACLGLQPWLLYVASVVASVAFVPLTWAIAEHLGPPPAAFPAFLPIVLPPPMISGMLTKAGGFTL